MANNIKKYDFKAGLSQEFEVVDLEDLYKNFKETLTTTHRAAFYHIIWFQKGSPTHIIDFVPTEITPNTLLFINKDTVQQFDGKEKIEGKAILFTDSFFCKTQDDTQFLRKTILFNDLFEVSKIEISTNEAVYRALFLEMEKELAKLKDNFQTYILKNHLHNFMLFAERDRRKQDFIEIKKGADLDYLMQFKELLETQYKQQKQVNYYAKQLSITEKRLNHSTAKVLDKTPKQIIDERIVLEAKRLLAHTTDSIKEIGFELGFDEPTNFIKYFKKHSQSTPMYFRENSRLA